MYSADLSSELNRIIEMVSLFSSNAALFTCNFDLDRIQSWGYGHSDCVAEFGHYTSPRCLIHLTTVEVLKWMLMTLDLNHCALSFPWQSYAKICRVVINWIYCTHEFIHDSNPGLLHARPIVDEYIHSTSYTYDKHTPRVVTWGISMVKEKWKWSW